MAANPRPYPASCGTGPLPGACPRFATSPPCVPRPAAPSACPPQN